MKSVLSLAIGLVVLLFALCTLQSFSYNGPKIKFTDEDKCNLPCLLTEAKKKDLPVFAHITSNDCTSCQDVSHNIYRDRKLIDYYNQNFLRITLNADESYNHYIKNILGLGQTASTLYFHPNGNLIEINTNMTKATDVVKFGEYIVSTMSDNADQANLFSMLERYNLGWRDPLFLKELAYLMKALGFEYHTVVNDYLATQSLMEMLTEQNRLFVYEFSDNMNNKAIEYLLADYYQYVALMGEVKVLNRIKTAAYNSVRQAGQSHNKGLLNLVLKYVEQPFIPNYQSMQLHLSAMYYESIGDWVKYSEKTDAIIEKEGIVDVVKFNLFVQNIIDNSEEITPLKNALNWSKKVVELEPSYYHQYIVAFIYYKLGRCKTSKKEAEEAIRIALYNNQFDVVGAKNLIEAIDAGKCVRY